MLRYVLPVVAILYALCPYDLVPDLLIGAGWLDDATLLGFLAWYLLRQKKRAHQGQRTEDRRGGSGTAGARQGGRQQTQAGPDPHGNDKWNPYRVLGVAPGASPDKIKRAYRDLASKYHPDKVSHLGEEFKVLAERRFKEIQEAYSELASPR